MKIVVRKNGAMVKMHNKRLQIVESMDDFVLQFKTLDKVEPDKPACIHQSHGNVRLTTIKISQEGMEGLIKAYIEYMISKSK